MLLKNPVILSTIPLIVSRAASIGVTIALLIPFQTDTAVDLIPLKTEESVFFKASNTEDTLLLMPSTTVLIAVLIPFHTVTATVFTALNTVVTTDLMAFSTVDIFVLTASQTVLITVFMVFMTVEITDATASITVETVLFIVFHTEIMVSLQFSHTKRNGSVMILNAASKSEPINRIPTCTTFLMFSHTPVKNDVIPFQIFVKNVDTEVHTAFQLVPNHPRTVSAIPRIRFNAAVKIPVIPFQMPENISLIPDHICSQFPVKSPINTSSSPVSTSSTVPRTVEMILNAASNTGARSSQKPFQIFFSVFTTAVKSILRAASLSLIPSTNACTFLTIPSQIAVMAFLNSSLVSHRCLNAATKTATTAITASTGPATAPSALASPVTEPLLPAIFTPRLAIPLAREEKPFIAVPTVEIVFPRMIRNGPMAAATAATRMIRFLWDSSMLFSLSTNPCILETRLWITGISASPKEMARPSTADFKMVI